MMDFFVGQSSNSDSAMSWSSVESDFIPIAQLVRFDSDSAYHAPSVASSDSSDAVIYWQDLVDEDVQVEMADSDARFDAVPLDVMVGQEYFLDWRGNQDRIAFYQFWLERGFFHNTINDLNDVPSLEIDEDILEDNQHLIDDDLAYDADSEPDSETEEESNSSVNNP